MSSSDKENIQRILLIYLHSFNDHMKAFSMYHHDYYYYYTKLNEKKRREEKEGEEREGEDRAREKNYI